MDESKSKMIPCRYMFSNGTEYEIFLDTQCYICKRFRNWHCKTVWAMEKARWEGEKAFPFDDLEEDSRTGWKYCKRFTEEPIFRQKRKKHPLNDQTKMEVCESDGN